MAGIEHDSARTPVERVTAPGSGDRAIGTVGTVARIVAGITFVLLGLLLDDDGIDWSALLLGLTAPLAIVTLAQLARISVTSTALRRTGPPAACLNLAVFGVLLALPWTSSATFVFLGASMVLAAWRGYAGCETLALSNWLLGRNDQVGCVLFAPVDAVEARLRAHDPPPTCTDSRTESHPDQGPPVLHPALLACKLAGCAALIALIAYGLAR